MARESGEADENTADPETGAAWEPEKKLWFVRYSKIAGTPLEKHIQVDGS